MSKPLTNQPPAPQPDHQPPDRAGPVSLVAITAVIVVWLDRFGLSHELIAMFLAFVGQVIEALLNAPPKE
jgi:hypothetical protein